MSYDLAAYTTWGATWIRKELLSIVLAEYPRKTEKDRHDIVVQNLPHNLSKLWQAKKEDGQALFDSIEIYSRFGEQALVYSSKDTPGEDPGKVMYDFYHRPLLTQEEAILHDLQRDVHLLQQELNRSDGLER